MAIKSKVTVKVDFSDIKRKFKNFVDEGFAKELGTAIVDDVKDFTAKGISPVRGEGKYAAYAAQRRDAVGDYPRGIKDVRPVNLRLSGAMMDAISFKKIKNGIQVGLITGSAKLKTIFRVHNEGERDDIPQRKILPTNDKDEFLVTIQNKIAKLFAKRLKQLLK